MSDWRKLSRAEEEMITTCPADHIILDQGDGLVSVHRDAYLEMVRRASVSAIQEAARILGLTSRDQIADMEVVPQADGSVTATITDTNGRTASASAPAPASAIGRKA